MLISQVKLQCRSTRFTRHPLVPISLASGPRSTLSQYLMSGFPIDLTTNSNHLLTQKYSCLVFSLLDLRKVFCNLTLLCEGYCPRIRSLTSEFSVRLAMKCFRMVSHSLYEDIINQRITSHPLIYTRICHLLNGSLLWRRTTLWFSISSLLAGLITTGPAQTPLTPSV